MNDPLKTGNKDSGVESLKEGLRTIATLLKFAMLILAVAFLLSGITKLEQFEKAVVLRFGAITTAIREDPGMLLALPFPIDKIIKIPAKRIQTLESDSFWYQLTDEERRTAETKKLPNSLKPAIDGYLITADRNIVHIRCILKYRISDPIKYAFGFCQFDELLRYHLDNTMIKVMTEMTAEQALENRTRLSLIITEMMQKKIEKIGFGVDIDPVDLQLNLPRQVQSDVNAVIQANQKFEEQRSTARVYAEKQMNEASSSVSQVRSTAQTWATRTITRANADAVTFGKLYPLYRENPDVIKQTLYQDRMRKIMSGVDEIFIIDPDDKREVRINLPSEIKRSEE